MDGFFGGFYEIGKGNGYSTGRTDNERNLSKQCWWLIKPADVWILDTKELLGDGGRIILRLNIPQPHKQHRARTSSHIHT